MRVLVVGHGLIGKQRAQALVDLNAAGDSAGEVTIAGTVDPAPRDPHLYKGAPHFASLDQVPDEAYDAAIIAVPHNFIEPICRRILGAGKPVLLEKPLGMSLEQAKAIHAAAKTPTLPSFVGYNYRFLPTMGVVYKCATDGTLGTLRNIDFFLGHGGHPKSTEDWKLKPEAAGGGALIDPGVHLLDLLLTLAPDAHCTRVEGTRGFWKTGIEEDVSALFRSGQMIGTVRVSLLRWVNTFRLEFGGDDGYALIEGRGGNYGAQVVRVGKRWGWNDGSKRSQKETENVHDFGTPNVSLRDELAAVVTRWLGGPGITTNPHPATMDESLKVATLLDQMYKSM